MKQFIRAYSEDTSGDAGTPIRFVASTEGVKRDGKDLKTTDWRVDNYLQNPVVLWAHDYQGRTLPIGRTVNLAIEDKRLIADIQFDGEDDFARQVEGKYRRGFLNAVSVGWGDQQEGLDLMDISAVPVPADPQALIERQRRAWQELAREMMTELEDARGAHPPHETPKADENMAWDGGAEVQKAEGEEQLWRMHAWRDDNIEPELKRAYKLPHHLASGQVVWRGVAAAMTRLLQAATAIPQADRRGVYNHLARHYAQFDKEVPEFRIEEPSQEGIEIMVEPQEAEETRIGAALSARNREKLEQAISIIQGVLDSTKKAEPEPEGDDEERTSEMIALLQLRDMITKIEV